MGTRSTGLLQSLEEDIGSLMRDAESMKSSTFEVDMRAIQLRDEVHYCKEITILYNGKVSGDPVAIAITNCNAFRLLAYICEAQIIADTFKSRPDRYERVEYCEQTIKRCLDIISMLMKSPDGDNDDDPGPGGGEGRRSSVFSSMADSLLDQLNKFRSTIRNSDYLDGLLRLLDWVYSEPFFFWPYRYYTARRNRVVFNYFVRAFESGPVYEQDLLDDVLRGIPSRTWRHSPNYLDGIPRDLVDLYCIAYCRRLHRHGDYKKPLPGELLASLVEHLVQSSTSPSGSSTGACLGRIEPRPIGGRLHAGGRCVRNRTRRMMPKGFERVRLSVCRNCLGECR